MYTDRHADFNKTAIYVGDLQSKQRKLVATAASNAVYAPPGFLLFLHDGNLMAQAFNPSSLGAGGDPVPIAERVDYVSSNSQAQFTVSQTGVLAYISSNNAQDPRLTWFDRDGKETGAIGRGYAPGISPDGRTIVFGRRNRQTGFEDIWLHDVERDTDSRLTSGPRSLLLPGLGPGWKPRRLWFGSR